MADGFQPATQPSNANSMIANALMQTQGYAAIPQIVRSQYVANFLQHMQDNPPVLRSAGALGTNLLAEAISQFANARMMKQIGGQLSQSTQQQLADAEKGAGMTDQPPDAGQVVTNQAAQQPPPQQAPAPFAQPSAQQQPATGTLDPAQFIRNWTFSNKAEGTGMMAHDSNGQPARYGIDAKFAPGVDLQHMTPDQAQSYLIDHVWSPSGAGRLPAPLAAAYFDTYMLNPTKAQQFLAQSQGDPNRLLDERDAFLTQLAQSPKFRQYGPAWEARTNALRQVVAGLSGQGAPQQPVPGLNMQPIGTAATGNGQAVPATQMLPGGPAQMPGPNGQGVMPPPPAQQGPPPPNPQAMGVPQAQGQPTAQQPSQGVPVGPAATQAEAQFIRDMTTRYAPGSGPYNAGLAKAWEVQQRHMAPVAAPKDMMWGPDGRAVPIPGTGVQSTIAGAPGTHFEVDPFHHQTAVTDPNAMQGNKVWNPQTGQYEFAKGLEPQTTGAFAPNTVYSTDPRTGAQSVVQAPPVAQEPTRQAFLGDDTVKSYNKSLTAAQGLYTAINTARQNNSAVGFATLTTALQSMGVTPRGNTVKDIEDSTGWGDQAARLYLKAMGQGGLAPAEMQNFLGVIQSRLQAEQSAANARMQSDTQAFGRPVPGEFVAPLPALPSLGNVGAGRQPPPVDPNIAAKAQRLGFHRVQLPDGSWGWAK